MNSRGVWAYRLKRILVLSEGGFIPMHFKCFMLFECYRLVLICSYMVLALDLEVLFLEMY